MDQINRWFNYFSIVKCNQTNGPDAKDQCFSITSLLQNTAYIPTPVDIFLVFFFFYLNHFMPCYSHEGTKT